MQLDKITSIDNYNMDARLYPVLQTLSRMTVDNYQDVIREATEVINFNEFETKHPDDCVYEGHEKAIDVHFILEGHERIYVQKKDLLTPKTAYNEADDFALFTGELMVDILLESGDFLVCYPDDAHQVGMRQGDVGEIVKKVVVKVPFE